MNPSHVRISPEIADAVAASVAVVALESTLITHGLPWPENRETALGAEQAVREAGAVPATIAIVGGEIRVGLSDEEIEAMARSSSFRKASRRDLGAVVALRKDGATTVSATVRIARELGIRVMATGGLGGVHRGASESFDVSTDLDELALADGVLVVCSGVKSILDIPATLEVLETRGVIVLGYRTDEFPAFTAYSSGLEIEWRVDSPEQAAEVVRSHRELGLPGAIVLAQPVSREIAIADDDLNAALAVAFDEAAGQGITGKAITPFLLEVCRRETSGRSLAANRALIVENARLAGEVAVALGRIGI